MAARVDEKAMILIILPLGLLLNGYSKIESPNFGSPYKKDTSLVRTRVMVRSWKIDSSD